MANLVILDNVEMHVFMFKCLYTAVCTIYIYTCVGVKKIYLNIKYTESSQYLVCSCNRCWQMGFPIYQVVIQGCRKPSIVATKELSVSMWVSMRQFMKLGVEAGTPETLKCHCSFVEMSANGLECNLVILNYYH